MPTAISASAPERSCPPCSPASSPDARDLVEHVRGAPRCDGLGTAGVSERSSRSRRHDMRDPLLQTIGSTHRALHNEAMDGAAGPRSLRALIRDATPDDASVIARIGRDAFADTHRELIAAALLSG